MNAAGQVAVFGQRTVPSAAAARLLPASAAGSLSPSSKHAAGVRGKRAQQLLIQLGANGQAAHRNPAVHQRSDQRWYVSGIEQIQLARAAADVDDRAGGRAPGKTGHGGVQRLLQIRRPQRLAAMSFSTASAISGLPAATSRGVIGAASRSTAIRWTRSCGPRFFNRPSRAARAWVRYWPVCEAEVLTSTTTSCGWAAAVPAAPSSPGRRSWCRRAGCRRPSERPADRPRRRGRMDGQHGGGQHSASSPEKQR